MSHYHGRSKPIHRQYKKSNTNPEVSMLASFGRGLYRLFSLPFNQKITKTTDSYSVDRRQIHSQWLEILELVKLGKPSNLQKAILSADKLLDFTLKNQRFSGDTMAERLRSAESRFSAYNDIWYAHKLRNRIVHDVNDEIQSYEINKAIKIYEKALKDLRVL
ncbi:MAG: hypothetical protein ABH837_00375 [bacterium]